MIVGFTGTQIGMSGKQISEFRRQLDVLDPIEFHHGDCVGADEEAHNIVTDYGIRVVIHPPDISSKRAFCKGVGVRVLGKKGYIARNHDIVDACDVLIAAPKHDVEELRSGTWATIRYARKLGKRVVILKR